MGAKQPPTSRKVWANSSDLGSPKHEFSPRKGRAILQGSAWGGVLGGTGFGRKSFVGFGTAWVGSSQELGYMVHNHG